MEENLIPIEKLLADNGICMLNGVSNNNNFKHYCFVSTYYKRRFQFRRIAILLKFALAMTCYLQFEQTTAA